mgnify:CR=1 FL=1
MSEVKFVDENGTEFVFKTADDLKEYLSGGDCNAVSIKRPMRQQNRIMHFRQKENGDFLIYEEGKGERLLTKDMDLWKEFNNLLGQMDRRKSD